MGHWLSQETLARSQTRSGPTDLCISILAHVPASRALEPSWSYSHLLIELRVQALELLHLNDGCGSVNLKAESRERGPIFRRATIHIGTSDKDDGPLFVNACASICSPGGTCHANRKRDLRRISQA